jgi:hypothetical protein
VWLQRARPHSAPCGKMLVFLSPSYRSSPRTSGSIAQSQGSLAPPDSQDSSTSSTRTACWPLQVADLEDPEVWHWLVSTFVALMPRLTG